MSTSDVCPLCDEPLPPEVVAGPPETHFRCVGCSVALTWKNGAAIPTPKSSAPRPILPSTSQFTSGSGILPAAPIGIAPLPRRPSQPLASRSPWSDATATELPRPAPSVPTEASAPSWLDAAGGAIPPEHQWSDATNVGPFSAEATRVDAPSASQRTQGMPSWIDDTLVRPNAAPVPLPRTGGTGSFPRAQPIPMQTQSLFAPFNAPAPLPRTSGTGSFPAATPLPSKGATGSFPAATPLKTSTTGSFAAVTRAKPLTGSFAALPRPAGSTTGAFPSVPKSLEEPPPPMASISDAILRPVPTPPMPTVLARKPVEGESSNATATALEPIGEPAPTNITAASLRPIDDPPTGQTAALEPVATNATGPSLQAVEEPGEATVAAAPMPVEKKPVRRTQVVAPKTPAPNAKLKLILIIAVPVAVLLVGLVLYFSLRTTTPTVIELPPRPEPIVAKPPPEPEPAATPEPVAPTPVPLEAPMLLAGKPVVLDYPDKPSPPVPGTNDAVIAKARALAEKGTARLDAKDGKAAVKFFRASMKTYPAYLAAYRGLGRSLAVTNDKKGALQMLNIYLRAVPEAEDAEDLKALVAKLSAPAPAKKKRKR